MILLIPDQMMLTFSRRAKKWLRPPVDSSHYAVNQATSLKRKSPSDMILLILDQMILILDLLVSLFIAISTKKGAAFNFLKPVTFTSNMNSILLLLLLFKAYLILWYST